MAEYSNQGRAGTAPAGRGASVASAANWAGALVSLLLIAGIAVWGYRLLVRDVTGVPVVRAAEGPMRVAPENPGGTPADHMGLAVNAVAGNGTAEPVPERVVLAPREIDLEADMDVVKAEEPAPEAAPEEEVMAEADAATDEDADAERIAAALSTQGDVATRMAALAEAMAGDDAPLSDLEEVSAVAPAEPAPAEVRVAEVQAKRIDAKGVAVSLRPLPRPQALDTAPRPEPAVAVAPAGPRDLDPEAIPAGTRLVQLGAYESPEVARGEWDKLTARFADFIDGKDRVIQRASSGGRTFYRLRAHGFEDLSDARRFCAALVAENADCIPVVTR